MATASSSLGQVTTKWTKPAATDGPNCRRTEPSKGKSASTEKMKLSSSPVAGVLLQQPANEDEPMRVKANGITFNCEVEGEDGAPWLVLSNSLACNLSMWDPQAAELKRSLRILRYDQRGHGQTDAPAGRYTFELLIADVMSLLDALSIPRAHFAGLSMGGATALGLALHHPDRFDRIIICEI